MNRATQDTHPESNDDMVFDEDVDFASVMQDVKPIKSDDKIFLQAGSSNDLAKRLRRESIAREQKRLENFLTLEDIEPLDPYAQLHFKQDGVQEGVFKNLRLGKYPLDHTLIIQKNKLEVAHEKVFNTIIQSHNYGHRALLIKHGLDIDRRPFSGYLKSYLNIWLHQMPHVIAFHSATARHGGLSATYVLLKKNQQQKEDNRELHKSR
ncbi:MAG: DNA endonuclease SmrA [Aestuariibacter sp.]